ncbi:MAG: F0F1 ATP synthase subunit delta [Patescibacteria group bacterium]
MAKMARNQYHVSQEKLVATVKSYVQLNEDERQRIRNLVGKLTGATANFHYETDKALLGGLRIEVGDWIVDTSLANALILIARRLKED